VGIGDVLGNEPEREVDVPNSFDRWLVTALVVAGLFGVLGFVSVLR
jgi:hypothetical protein